MKNSRTASPTRTDTASDTHSTAGVLQPARCSMPLRGRCVRGGRGRRRPRCGGPWRQICATSRLRGAAGSSSNRRALRGRHGRGCHGASLRPHRVFRAATRAPSDPTSPNRERASRPGQRPNRPERQRRASPPSRSPLPSTGTRSRSRHDSQWTHDDRLLDIAASADRQIWRDWPATPRTGTHATRSRTRPPVTVGGADSISVWTAQAGGEPSRGVGGKGRAGDWRASPAPLGPDNP
jgi:hypothetical protein